MNMISIQPLVSRSLPEFSSRVQENITVPALFEVKAPEGAYLTNKTQF